MAQFLAFTLGLALVLGTPGLRATSDSGHAATKAPKKPDEVLTASERLDFIRRAQVWTPTDVAAMDLRAGPQFSGAFAPGAMVSCDYVEQKAHGSSRKFDCTFGEDDVVKVRYGLNNGEVFGSVVATRLLWALGFGADRVYPVKVMCHGCSNDPWTERKAIDSWHLFDPASIERKPAGHSVKADHDSGWSWRELNLVDPGEGGAPKEQRDALTLLAVFMQHTDSKPEQQRLVCLSDVSDDGYCDTPFMLIHDVGLTFGHGNLTNSTPTGSVNLEQWQKAPVWREPAACVAHLSRSYSGTLGDPVIGEAGRAFLAKLLVQLSDDQLTDLFDVARVTMRGRNPSTDHDEPVSVADWVDAFKHKRDEIVMNHCPA